MITAPVHFVIYIIVLGVVAWLLLYLIDMIPLSEPFNRVAKIVITVVGILILILLMLQFAGIVEPGLR